MIEEALRLAIAGVVFLFVAALLTGIVAVTGYAVLHAWRTGRVGWAISLVALFLIGWGLATVASLVLHHDEPLPRRRRVDAVRAA